ncbi:MAG: VWA domain-containing protein [Gammaproteobacteria bacterium]|nr:VWA domain-containing protein [Gammaproteobacteria bacterium]
MIEFVWLWALFLIPLPIVVYYLAPSAKQLQQTALKVPNAAPLQIATLSSSGASKQPLLLFLASIAWLLFVLALARPQWLGDPIELPVTGRDLMLAVDLSGSMKEKDFNINGEAVDRLTATKYVAGEFIKQRVGDRLGLILFGERAYLQAPLTFDLTTVNTLLQESVIGLAGIKTAIGDAIGLSLKRLAKLKQKSRVLILLTDGANTSGEVLPMKAAQLAAQQNLKIYTIGIGADEMIKQSFFGAQVVNPSADLDEKTLRFIADQTGGRYFRARDTQELATIYSLLDELEPAEQKSETLRPAQALYYWPLGLSLLLLLTVLSLRLKGMKG